MFYNCFFITTGYSWSYFLSFELSVFTNVSYSFGLSHCCLFLLCLMIWIYCSASPLDLCMGLLPPYFNQVFIQIHPNRKWFFRLRNLLTSRFIYNYIKHNFSMQCYTYYKFVSTSQPIKVPAVQNCCSKVRKPSTKILPLSRADSPTGGAEVGVAWKRELASQ